MKRDTRANGHSSGIGKKQLLVRLVGCSDQHILSYDVDMQGGIKREELFDCIEKHVDTFALLQAPYKKHPDLSGQSWGSDRQSACPILEPQRGNAYPRWVKFEAICVL